MTSKAVRNAIAVADAATLFLALTVLTIVMLTRFRQDSSGLDDADVAWRRQFASSGRPCDEIYVVREGETLQTIIDKCGDPFIVEQNPHIHDPDDVFPGLVIRITPSGPKSSERTAIDNFVL